MAAHPPLTRPQPTVLQSKDAAYRRSHVSFSSTAESSLQHSGESWFQLSASNTSSHTSHSSVVPLPKGARPPSPQPSRLCANERQPDSRANQGQPPLKRTGTFSSWKIEWRGISKIVRWAVLGERSSDKGKARNTNPSRQSKSDAKSSMSAPQARHLDTPLQQGFREFDPSYKSYCSPTPTSPLSPTSSTSCVDLTEDNERLVMHSELGHGIGPGSPGIPFPNSYQAPRSHYGMARRRGSMTALRRADHVQNQSYTNMQHVLAEQGHAVLEDGPFDAHYTASDIGHSSHMYEGPSTLNSPHYPGRTRIAYSDIGHGGAPAMSSDVFSTDAFPSAMSSSSILPESGGRGFYLMMPSNGRRPLKPFHDVEPAVALPLRKSIRGSTTTKSGMTASLSMTSVTMHATTFEHKSTPFLSSLLSTPLVTKSPPRPARKLTKKPSPALPPLPRAERQNLPDLPPPVPPKPTSILKRPSEYSLRKPPPPLPSNSEMSSHDSTFPGLTNSSGSSSQGDEVVESLESAGKRDASITRRPQRPSFLRSESNRRWTVAVAEVPDDLFMQELERLRRMGLRAGEVHGVQETNSQNPSLMNSKATAVTAVSEKHIEVQMHDAGRRIETHHVDKTKFMERSSVVVKEVDGQEETDWIHARRAILCCRELVRTERSYLARLQELAAGEVSDEVPSLSLHYLPALINASKILSSYFNEDMSASGVSNAFIHAERALEAAFVAWSGVVGEFFGGVRESRHLQKHTRNVTVNGTIGKELHTVEEFGEGRDQRVSVHGREEAVVTQAVSAITQATRTSSTHWLFRPAFSQSPSDSSDEKDAFSGFRKSMRINMNNKSRRGKDGKRRSPFRELAILPTQRVTRYVLLYKDLLKHTPLSSPTREVVEKAVSCADRLARRCDRAQGNSAFIQA